jgi:hypothetical protein
MNPCALNIPTETLSAFYSHLLPDDERAALEAHIADCAACRYHLAAYAAIRHVLRRQRSPVDAETVWRRLDDQIIMKRGSFMFQAPKIAWLSGLALFAVVVIAFVAVFALQSSHHTTPITIVSPTPTGTATMAPTATAKPVPTLTAQQFDACFGVPSDGVIQRNEIVRIGDIALASKIATVLPLRMLPEGATSPYRLTGDPSNNFASSFVGEADPLVNPTQPNQNPYASKLYFQICNLSTSTTYHVSTVGATISRFTSYSGSLNVASHPCSESYYSSATHQDIETGGCGWATGPLNIIANATFPPGSTTGMGVTGVMTKDTTKTTMAPGKFLTGMFYITLPSTPGTYSVSPTVQFDGGSTISGVPIPPYIYAPVAHVWDGKACTNVSIPASPPAYYICRN